MNKYQLNAPIHATHYRILPYGKVVYYHISHKVHVYQDETWIEKNGRIDFEGELISL